MENAAFAAGFADLCAGVIALEIFSFLDPQSGAQALLLDSVLELLLPLGAVVVLFAAAAFIYHHLSHAAVPAANGRLSAVVIFTLCVSAGVLDFYLFVQPAGSVDHGAQARALGQAAFRSLPTAATATFFWGMMLIIIAHIRAGGEGGGGAGAIQGPVRLLTKIALGAAAGLVFLMIVAALCIICRY